MGKHRLILMRHAKSDWDAEFGSDFDRPLSRRGRKDAQRMARYLLEQDLAPISIVSSPALRAKQTAEYVADALTGSKSAITFANALYDADVGTVLEVIEQYRDSNPGLLIIAHNPALDQVYSLLSKPPVSYNSKGKLLTTAAIAVLDFEGGKISTRENSATQQLLIRPKELA